MSFTFLGTKSVGSFAKSLPDLALPELLAFLAELTRQQGDFSARLATYVQLSGIAITDPATLIAQLTAAIAALKDQIAAIVAGAIPAIPTITASVDADLAILLPKLAALQLIVDQINAAISLGGLHCFKVDSTPADLGGEVSSLIGGGIAGGLASARIRGVMAVTEDPATFLALQGLILTG